MCKAYEKKKNLVRNNCGLLFSYSLFIIFFFVIKNRINNLKTGIEIISWSIVAIIIVLHEKRYREN